MILLTTADNDKDLIPIFGSRAIPVPLEHGDFSWMGVWSNDEPIQVCGDRKKVDDLIACVTDGRHMEQVRKAYEAGFTRQFIIVEGQYRKSTHSGILEVPRRGGWIESFTGIEYHRVAAYLNQLHWLLNVQVMRSASPRDTVEQVCELHSMFQQAPENHKSLQKIFSPPPPRVDLMRRPTVEEKVAVQLPGLGWGRGRAAAEHFISIKRLANATPEDWMEIDGIGEKTAVNVVEAINGHG
jgi:ERCC4-type nuclease